MLYVLNCALPHIHLILYPDCVGCTGHRKLESATKLLLAVTICRHGLHQGIMGYIVGMSNAAVQHIISGLVIFLTTLINDYRDIHWNIQSFINHHRDIQYLLKIAMV